MGVFLKKTNTVLLEWLMKGNFTGNTGAISKII